MLVIKDEAKITVDYPIEKFADKEKILYFDIETTGLSRKYCSIYLIGAMYFDEGKWMYAQWFADNYNDEANVIMAFQKFIKDYDCLIHFNGNSFDIPFVKERAEKYNIDLDLDRLKSVDIYKDISSLKNILNLPNLKQKTLEKAIGIKRSDPFSGGELVEVYKEYVRTKDQKLIYPLLLHNREDVLYMGKITELLNLCDFFEGSFEISDWNVSEYKDMDGNDKKELVINIITDKSISAVDISQTDNAYSLLIRDNKCQLKIKVLQDTLKLFFDNYKDYYYLPEEDKAIHKSVSQFVDKKYREQAKASTCYENVNDCFVSAYGDFKYLFRPEYNSKYEFIRVSDLNDDNLRYYLKGFLKSL